MTPEQRTAARARCEKSTPGDWKLCLHLEEREKCDCPCGYRGGIWSGDGERIVCEMGGSPEKDGTKMVPEGSREQQFEDAAFIAHSRTDLPAALDALDAADQDRYRFVIERAEKDQRIAELEADKARLKRLLKLAESAPHEDSPRGGRCSSYNGMACTCWKKEAREIDYAMKPAAFDPAEPKAARSIP